MLRQGKDRLRPGAQDGPDDGFTLLEVLISVAIIAVVMLGLGAVFVATASGTDAEGSRQTAARIATGGLDRVHALSGVTAANCRRTADVDTQWRTRTAGVTTLIGALPRAYDTLTTTCTGGGGSAPLPTTPVLSTVDGVQYSQQFFVATCALDAAQTCRAPGTTGTVAMFDVVVSVTWRGARCAQATCSYEVSALLPTGTADPVFDSNVVAVPPVVADIAAQVNDATEQVSGLVVRYTGGNGRVTFTADGLPAGVTIAADGTISGTLADVASSRTVTITAVDQFDLPGSTFFTWTVNPRPTLTGGVATVLTTAVGSTLDLTTVLRRTGGTPGYTWACTGLPVGTDLNRDTGVITLTAGLVAAVVAPVCTVTDARGVSANATLTLTVLAPLAVSTPAANSTTSTPRGRAFSGSAYVASGGTGGYTWTATGLPSGLTLAANGVVSGTTPAVRAVTSFRPTVTVRDSAGTTVAVTFTWTIT